MSSGRPIFHFTPPKGWLNDPCAPGFDEKTQTYHLFYQWNPKTVEWGDISWGHATSKDLIHWKYSSVDRPVFIPDQPYDKDGVFTGCFLQEDDKLSVFYTNVNHLPIHWSQPYHRGCEGVAHAFSVDNGKTWKKSSSNPILKEEPPEIDVTGFRDPFISACPEFDSILGKESMYALVSGGIRDVGPRLFLYTLGKGNTEKWKYLFPLLNTIPVGFGAEKRWAGDFGVNLECGSFVQLSSDDQKHSRLAFLAGAEGGGEPEHITQYHKSQTRAPHRTPRWSNWFFATPKPTSDSQFDLQIDQAGQYDHGILYAAAPHRSKDGRTILQGWLIEEDLPVGELQAKGWCGDLGIPRELFVSVLDNVRGALCGNLDEIDSMAKVDSSDNTQILTLGIRPLRELESLRESPLKLQVPKALGAQSLHTLISKCPLSAELRLAFNVTTACKAVTVILRHNKDFSIKTEVSVDFKKSVVSLKRALSNARPDIHKADEIGAFSLFTFEDGTVEPLELRIYLDNDILEIFANNRFSLSSRVYSLTDCTGLSLQIDGAPSSVQLLDSQVWPLKSIGLLEQLVTRKSLCISS